MSPRRTSAAQHHVEWLQLVDVSGPFLSLGVLAEVFPQGLDAVESELANRLKQAHVEWQANREQRRPDVAIDTAFIEFVLREVLEYPDEMIATGAEIGDAYSASLPELRVTLRADFAVRRPAESPKVLASVYPPDVALGKPLSERGLHASPTERMRLLLSRTGVRSGLVTNGREWTLVHAPAERTATFVTWYANLLVEERVTLRALCALLGVRRLFGVNDAETLDGLFDRSRDDEREVTHQLGYQARRAVELLVAALDRADRDTSGKLLADVSEHRLYEATLAVVMRVIFLLAAEARGLFPDDGPWAESYALAPLRAELEAQADRHGIEVLERRFDAWSRLLATFRAVHGGVEHSRVRMPGYGGGLFDPDRYPFLDGAGSALPRVSNRAVLHVLDALQTLEVDVGGGRERRPLSFRALGVEQIGHVYEGLLDHTAIRADSPALGLTGTTKNEPELALKLLEEQGAKGEDALLELLKVETGRSVSALRKALNAEPSAERVAWLRVGCNHDAALSDRVLPYLGLVRDDVYGVPMVFGEGQVYVTESPFRRATGTHYTPPSLTEPIVQYALESVVYRGPAEGLPRQQWEVKRPTELLELKVCDIAMGSAAFLVAACRYLAARLVDAWELHPEEAPADAGVDLEERDLTARRLVAERCLYGVDVNPLAVEIAKVSLWLTTLRRDRPFTFVDHALRCGDSLVGVSRSRELEALSTRNPEARSLLAEPARRAMAQTLADVSDIRSRLESTDASAIRDIERKQAELASVGRATRSLKAVADSLVSAALQEAATGLKATVTIDAVSDRLSELLSNASASSEGDAEELHVLAGSPWTPSDIVSPESYGYFHWILEFPEVFHRDNPGFDAIVGNPPFLNAIESKSRSAEYVNVYFRNHFAPFTEGAFDYCLIFWARATMHLLRVGARFGMLSPTALLSSTSPWQGWMHETWRPDHFRLYPVDEFEGSRIRTTAIIGGMGTAPDIEVTDLDGSPAPGKFVAAWGEGSVGWYEVTRRDGIGAATTANLPLVESQFEVRAGCATGVAYELKPLVEDLRLGDGLRLVTTGALDRYAMTWGIKPIRYLKGDYQFPRWPLVGAPAGVVRARDAQRRQKIIIGGLTSVIEAWLDEAADAAGVVSTWVVDSKQDFGIELLFRLLAVLNSSSFSRIYMQRHGGSSMSGSQTTIKKAGLLAMPIPSMLLGIESHATRADECIDNVVTHQLDAPAGDLLTFIGEAASALQALGASDTSASKLDKACHLIVSHLYARTPVEAEEDYVWWCQRANVEPESERLDELLRPTIIREMKGRRAARV